MAAPLQAQDDVDVPYWASIRSTVVNLRVGPATSYPIEWVYKRPELPVRVVRRKEGWRLIEDPDGSRGWMVSRFLTRTRTAIVIGKGLAEMRDRTGPESRLMWQLEPGVTGKLGKCADGWCRFEVGPHKGLAPQSRLWGAGEP
jgi:SH3-like domain-containing protein